MQRALPANRRLKRLTRPSSVTTVEVLPWKKGWLPLQISTAEAGPGSVLVCQRLAHSGKRPASTTAAQRRRSSSECSCISAISMASATCSTNAGFFRGAGTHQCSCPGCRWWSAPPRRCRSPWPRCATQGGCPSWPWPPPGSGGKLRRGVRLARNGASSTAAPQAAEGRRSQPVRPDAQFRRQQASNESQCDNVRGPEQQQSAPARGGAWTGSRSHATPHLRALARRLHAAWPAGEGPGCASGLHVSARCFCVCVGQPARPLADIARFKAPTKQEGGNRECLCHFILLVLSGAAGLELWSLQIFSWPG